MVSAKRLHSTGSPYPGCATLSLSYFYSLQTQTPFFFQGSAQLGRMFYGAAVCVLITMTIYVFLKQEA